MTKDEDPIVGSGGANKPEAAEERPTGDAALTDPSEGDGAARELDQERGDRE